MQPYRVFVNALGVSNEILLYPETAYNFSLIRVPLKTYSYWYWNLRKLTISYHYRIDNEHIRHSITLEPNPSNLVERIRGYNPWGLKTSDDAAKTKTRVNLGLGMPLDASIPIHQRYTIGQKNDAAFSEKRKQCGVLSKNPPRICGDRLLPLETPIGIIFRFDEEGYSLDHPGLAEFELRTYPTPSFRTDWYTLSTLNTTLMEQTFPVELRSLYASNEIEGELIEFNITPEFHTFAKTENG